MVLTWQKTFIRIMLSNQNLLHTLYFADLLHNLKRYTTLIHYTTFFTIIVFAYLYVKPLKMYM